VLHANPNASLNPGLNPSLSKEFTAEASEIPELEQGVTTAVMFIVILFNNL